MKPAVATYQVTWELGHLLDLVTETIRPKRVLEVGCYEGGTLWHWLQIADQVVAVDDVCRNSEDWQEWATTGATLHVVHGDSHAVDTIMEVEGYGPYDFIFIDGDHTYLHVSSDWLNYSPMIAPGGAIAFHDILPRPGYGVSAVWAEVKEIEGVRWIEICQNAVEPGNEGRCGIGVAWL